MKKSNNPILKQIASQATMAENQEELLQSSCLLRSCFDTASAEWSWSTMNEKVEALRVLINDEDSNTLKLSMDMLSFCNEEAGKDIKMIDLVISMSYIIDHLLTNKDSK